MILCGLQLEIAHAFCVLVARSNFAECGRKQTGVLDFLVVVLHVPSAEFVWWPFSTSHLE